MLTGAPDAVAATVAQTLFASAPMVVVAGASHAAGLKAAVAQAGRAHAPLLLASSRAGADAAAALRAAGAQVIAVRGYDPRADPAAIAALSADKPRQVLAAGAGFGPAGRLACRPPGAVPVVPAFEIIATVAEARPEADGSYSYQSPLSLLRPWVARATAAGMYVVLDLQAGRDSLLTQAKRYRSLLARPNVGLALDPEGKLQPRQRTSMRRTIPC